MIYIRLATLGVALLLLISCAKKPQIEIDLANAAIEGAKVAGALDYYPEDFTALVDSMNSVNSILETETLHMFPDYRQAKENLANIVTFASEIETKSINKKEELKSQIKLTFEEVMTMMVESNKLMEGLQEKKESAADLVDIKKELTNLETSVTEANSLMEKGDYLTTMSQAKTIKEKASTLNSDLKQIVSGNKTVVNTAKKS